MQEHEPLETPADFGTGLRAHLGLEQPTPAPEPVEHAAEPDPEPQPDAEPLHDEELEALAELEAQLHAREEVLAAREALLAARADALLAEARALHATVVAPPAPVADELALRRARR